MKREREDSYKDKEAEKVRTKKSLGQHFLSDPNILDKIVRAGKIERGDTVLEIGPGEGALTEALLRAGANIVAIEKDDRLIPILENKFSAEINAENFLLIHGDILETRSVLEEKLKDRNYKVVANIPYYITGKIVRFLFSLDVLPNTITLLVQDEVARRATSDKESLLSLSIKAFGEPHYRGKVKAGSFSPPPKVDSAILTIENISSGFFSDLSEDLFFKTIKKSFSQKRKTLLNTFFSDNKELGIEILNELNLALAIRPEEIHIDEWKLLIQSLYKDGNNRR